MTKEELKRLNELVSPLILQHQSLNHIYATHAEEIGVSRATLYKYIAFTLLERGTAAQLYQDITAEINSPDMIRTGPDPD